MLPTATLKETRADVRRTRRNGLGMAAIGLVVSLVAVLVLRLQSGNAQVVVSGASILGPIVCGVGLFQVISGRNEERKGLGLVGLVFVVLFGFAGAFAVFAFGMRSTKHAPPVTRMPDSVRELDELSRSLKNVTVTPANPPP